MAFNYPFHWNSGSSSLRSSHNMQGLISEGSQVYNCKSKWGRPNQRLLSAGESRRDFTLSRTSLRTLPVPSSITPLPLAQGLKRKVIQMQNDMPSPIKKARQTISDLTHEEKDVPDSWGFRDGQVTAKGILHSIVIEQRLLSFYKQNIVVDAADKKECVAIVCETLEKIMVHVRSQNGGNFYSSSLLKAGSHAVKTKIGMADEFDWLVPLNAMARKEKYGYRNFSLLTQMVFKMPGSTPILYKNTSRSVRVPVGSWTPNCCIEGANVPADVINNGFIVPQLVKKDLGNKIRTAIKATQLDKRGVYLSPKSHGPTLKIMILRDGKHDISIDVTPSLPMDLPVTTNGWPTERAYMHQLLHMNERQFSPGYWDQRNFVERVLEMLKDCEHILRSGHLPNYFNGRENILEGKDRHILNALADHFSCEREKLISL